MARVIIQPTGDIMIALSKPEMAKVRRMKAETGTLFQELLGQAITEHLDLCE